MLLFFYGLVLFTISSNHSIRKTFKCKLKTIHKYLLYKTMHYTFLHCPDLFLLLSLRDDEKK